MKILKKFLIIIAIIILVVISIVLLRNFINDKKVEETAKLDAQLRKESIENYSAGKVFPRGMAELMTKYDGQNDKNDLYRSLNRLTREYIPTLYKDINGLDKSKLSKYFNDNKNTIINNLGLNKEEDFINLATYLQNSNYEGSNFEYCEIDSSTYRTAGKNRYLTFIMDFKYENLEEPLRLRTYFANMTSTNPKIIYAMAE